MIKKIILYYLITICTVFAVGCSKNSIHPSDSPSASASPTKTLTPTLVPTEAAPEITVEAQTETEQSDITEQADISEQSDIIELQTLHSVDLYEGGKIFVDITENDLKFFEDIITKLTIPDARKGERARSILEGNAWNKGIILLNSIPEKNIYLYGYNDEEHYGFGLILDIGEVQHIYSFPYRYMTTTSIPPSISTSEDGSKIFVSCLTGSGTGVSESELYVFQVNSGVESYYVDINELIELFSNRITMSYNSENKLMAVYSDGKHIMTDNLIDSDVTPSGFYCGNFVSYDINNDTVKAICKPTINIQEMPIGSYLKYVSLEAEIKFEYDSNGKITGFDLGEIKAVSSADIYGSNIYTKVGADSQTQSDLYPQILDNVNDDLKERYSDIDFTNEWIGRYGNIVLFGSLKSDPLQGIAIDIDTENAYATVRYLAPEKYGAISAQSLMESPFAVQVSAENGHVWIYNLYGLGFSEKTSGGVYAGKWEQIERLRYVEGALVSVNENEDGTAVIELQITVNYHGGADPVDSPDFPYPVGSLQEFVLQSLSGIQLDRGEDIVVYQTGVLPLSGSMERFVGAVVMYYKKDGIYYDTDNNTVTMPPQEYPQFEEVFNQSID